MGDTGPCGLLISSSDCKAIGEIVADARQSMGEMVMLTPRKI